MPSPAQNRLARKREKLKRRGGDGVSDIQIYQRDNWQCQLPECLCPDGRALNPALRGTAGLWSPAVHHIIRLADGGLGNAANKLAAHNKCSSMANSRIQRAQARERRAATSRVTVVFGDAGEAARFAAALARPGAHQGNEIACCAVQSVMLDGVPVTPVLLADGEWHEDLRDDAVPDAG